MARFGAMTLLDSGCMACDIVAGRRHPPGGAIYRDAHWMVDHQCQPVEMPGYLIVKPTRHVEGLGELTPEEAASLGPVLRATCLALSRVIQPERTYAISMGEAVRHVHFLIIPRTAAMTARGLGAVEEVWSGKWATTDQDAEAVATRVREEMQRIMEAGAPS
jgi:diadenosine tetraphosphate (Ap4A) HIT family hydrolase